MEKQLAVLEKAIQIIPDEIKYMRKYLIVYLTEFEAEIDDTLPNIDNLMGKIKYGI